MSDYHYKHKEYTMTPGERGFFRSLIEIYSNDYFVFPQVHLESILEYHHIYGQDEMVALGRIIKKSVDYVLCDRLEIKTILAIELDDHFHDREDRIRRDKTVEEMFKEANLPLVRFRHQETQDLDLIKQKISEKLPK